MIDPRRLPVAAILILALSACGSGEDTGGPVDTSSLTDSDELAETEVISSAEDGELGPPVALTLSPGFSCDEAQSGVERAICASATLSSLDQAISQLYGSATETDEPTARVKQRAWLAERNQCADNDCLVLAYTDRLSELINSNGRIPTLGRGDQSANLKIIELGSDAFAFAIYASFGSGGATHFGETSGVFQARNGQAVFDEEGGRLGFKKLSNGWRVTQANGYQNALNVSFSGDYFASNKEASNTELAAVTDDEDKLLSACSGTYAYIPRDMDDEVAFSVEVQPTAVEVLFTDRGKIFAKKTVEADGLVAFQETGGPPSHLRCSGQTATVVFPADEQTSGGSFLLQKIQGDIWTVAAQRGWRIDE